jgi:uncharacterized coiled-coil protein SlyX
MERRRRNEDPKLEDHRQERTDWRVAPQWVLVVSLTISIAIGSMTGTALFHMVMQREAEIKLAYGEPNTKAIADIERRLYRLEIKAAALDERLPAYNELNHRLVQVSQNIDRLNAQLKRRGGM